MSATNVIEMKNSNSKQSQGSLTYAFHEHQLSAPVIHSTIYLQEQNRIRLGKQHMENGKYLASSI